jgi:hypothetical protein
MEPSGRGRCGHPSLAGFCLCDSSRYRYYNALSFFSLHITYLYSLVSLKNIRKFCVFSFYSISIKIKNLVPHLNSSSPAANNLAFVTKLTSFSFLFKIWSAKP